jgi:hypothetical protein
MGHIKWWIAVAVAGATCFAGWRLHAAVKAEAQAQGRAQIQALWDAEKLVTAQVMQEQMVQARQREQALQAKTEQLQQERRLELARLARRHADLVDSLRERPEARAGIGAGGVPEVASAGVGCTGAGLARRDATFLAGFAADAARLQAALHTCESAYDQARTLTMAP